MTHGFVGPKINIELYGNIGLGPFISFPVLSSLSGSLLARGGMLIVLLLSVLTAMKQRYAWTAVYTVMLSNTKLNTKYHLFRKITLNVDARDKISLWQKTWWQGILLSAIYSIQFGQFCRDVFLPIGLTALIMDPTPTVFSQQISETAVKSA